jgi:hypothetical protein
MSDMGVIFALQLACESGQQSPAVHDDGLSAAKPALHEVKVRCGNFLWLAHTTNEQLLARVAVHLLAIGFGDVGPQGSADEAGAHGIDADRRELDGERARERLRRARRSRSALVHLRCSWQPVSHPRLIAIPNYRA